MALRRRSVGRIVVLAVAMIVGSFAIPGRALAVILCNVPVTTSFTLPGNLSCPGTNGIVIGADNIVVNLGGHTISSNSTTSTVGVKLAGHSGVVVRNGEVDAFDISIDVDGSKNLVEGIRTFGSGIDVSGSGHTITGNEVFNTDGLSSTATKTAITRNLIDLGGIYLAGNACCTVDGNTVMDTVDGFRNDSPAKTTFSNNVALRNRGNGFIFYGPPGKVIGNMAVDNGDFGFYDATAAGTALTFLNNVAQGNGFRDGVLGFQLVSAAKAKGNIATNNADPNNCAPTSACAGPPLTPETPPACGTSITHSILLSASKGCSGSDGYSVDADNVVVDLGGHQLGLSGGGHYNGIFVGNHKNVTIRNGVITGFNDDVLAVGGMKVRVEGISADGAAFDGFAADGGDVTFVGNVARGGAYGFAGYGGGKVSLLRNAALTSTFEGFRTDSDIEAILDGDFAGPNVTATSGNGRYGFAIDGDKNTVTHDIAIESFSHGFVFNATSGKKLIDDVAFENGGDGFRVNTPKAWSLTGDVGVRNGFQGGNTDTLGRGFEFLSSPAPKEKGVVATLNDDPTNCSAQMTC